MAALVVPYLEGQKSRRGTGDWSSSLPQNRLPNFLRLEPELFVDNSMDYLLLKSLQTWLKSALLLGSGSKRKLRRCQRVAVAFLTSGSRQLDWDSMVSRVRSVALAVAMPRRPHITGNLRTMKGIHFEEVIKKKWPQIEEEDWKQRCRH